MRAGRIHENSVRFLEIRKSDTGTSSSIRGLANKSKATVAEWIEKRRQGVMSV
jgi:hypothetical protein